MTTRESFLLASLESVCQVPGKKSHDIIIIEQKVEDASVVFVWTVAL